MPTLAIPVAPRPRSFRAQSAWRHGALVVVLALALPALFAYLLSGSQRRDEALALQAVAQGIARTLAAGLDERAYQVESLAANAALWSEGLDSAIARRAIAQAHGSTPYSSWIGVADADGSVRADHPGVLQGVSVAARPWFQAGLQGAFVGDVHEAVLLAKLLPGLPGLPGRPGHEPLRFVDFAAPIYIGGRVAGVLGLHGSWEWARSVVARMAPPHAEQRQLEILIFDRRGQLIYAPPGLAASGAAAPTLPATATTLATLEDGSFTARWNDAVDYLAAASRLKTQHAAGDLGWTVVVREPTELAYAQARRSVGIALLVGLLAALVAALMAYRVSARLSRPLTAMAQAARRLEAGVEGADIAVDTGSAELDDLSTALTGMTRKLLRSRDELEVRVLERTAQLEEVNRELAQLARHDPLTGLPNRRAFDERLLQALAAARRQAQPVSVLMIDVDHFKRVNDRFGHEAGDEVLKRLAAVLTARLRETDCAARLGGEEFAVLLPATGEDGAFFVAEEIVARAAATVFPVAGAVTVSVGVASGGPLDIAGDHVPADLLRRADQALYRAKQGGRNRACTLALALAD